MRNKIGFVSQQVEDNLVEALDNGEVVNVEQDTCDALKSVYGHLLDYKQNGRNLYKVCVGDKAYC